MEFVKKNNSIYIDMLLLDRLNAIFINYSSNKNTDKKL